MINWLKRIVGLPQQTRALSVQDLKNLVYGPPTLAGVAISEEMATGLPVVWRAIDLISSKIASLDVHVYQNRPNRGSVRQHFHPITQLLASPCDISTGMNRFKFWRTYIMHVVCGGNGYALIQAKGKRPYELSLVHWRDVNVLQDGRRMHDRETDMQTPIVYELTYNGELISPESILHTTALSWNGVLGMSPIRAMRESLGIAVAQERYAGTLYGNSATPRGVLKISTVDKTGGLSPETKANIRDAWNVIHGGPEASNKVAILPPGVEWVETNMTPADAEFTLSRNWTIEETARIFGIPTCLLFSGNQQSYNANEQNMTAFYQLGLKPIIENLEAEFDSKLLSLEERLQGYFVKFDVSKLDKGNYADDVNSETRLVLSGIKTVNEARESLGLNPDKGGDERLVPTNMQLGMDLVAKPIPHQDVQKQLDAPKEVEDTDQVQDTALNGAQIASLLELVESVSQGSIPLDSAKGMIAASFPTLSGEQIDDILAPLQGFTTSVPDLEDATRAVLLQELERARKRCVKSPDKDHTSYLSEALSPSYRAYALATRREPSFTDFLTRFQAIKLDNPITTEVLNELF